MRQRRTVRRLRSLSSTPDELTETPPRAEVVGAKVGKLLQDAQDYRDEAEEAEREAEAERLEEKAKRAPLTAPSLELFDS